MISVVDGFAPLVSSCFATLVESASSLHTPGAALKKLES